MSTTWNTRGNGQRGRPIGTEQAATEQSELGPRLTYRFVWAEVLAFISWEKGALYTLACMLVGPGNTVHRYLRGERKRLTNPIRFLLMTVAAVTASFVFLMPRDAYISEDAIPQAMRTDQEVPPGLEAKLDAARQILTEIAGTGEAAEDGAQQGQDAEREKERAGSTVGTKVVQKNAQLALEQLDRSLMHRAGEISLTWMNIFLLFGVPINALLTWGFFRAARLNLTEHVAANAYILAIQNFAAVLTVPLAWIDPKSYAIVTLLYMLVSFIYQFWAWRQVFELRSWTKLIVCFFALILSVVGFVVLQGIATSLIMAFAS